MKKNDIFQMEIIDMGVDGEGIGKYEGMTFFVKDAVIGDVIRAKAMKLKKNYGYARVEEVITPSPFRVEPRCVHHRRCGGCQIQALSYEKQLEFKHQKVRGNLIRIGGFSEEEVDAKMFPIVGMEEPFRYRNKAQFPIGTDKEGNIITGFYAARTHSIIPVEDCLLGVWENAPILEAVKEWMNAYKISAYDESTGKGLLRHVLVRFGFTTKQIMVCLIINGKKLPAKEVLIEKLAKIEGMTSISININTQNTNVILGDVTECIWGEAFITDYIHLRKCGTDFTDRQGNADMLSEADEIRKDKCVCEKIGNWENIKNSGKAEIAEKRESMQKAESEKLTQEDKKVEKSGEVENSRKVENSGKMEDNAKVEDNGKVKNVKRIEKAEFALTDTAVAYRISPQSFYQVNPVQTEKLYSTALEYAGLTGKEYVWDLYCGIGTISLFLAQKAKKVYGVEIVPQAIEDAKNNARLNEITNAEFFVGKAEEVLPKFYEKAQGEMLHPDVMVVDPPRKGCDEACLDMMLRMQPQRIVYVSCDSATLARDMRILCDGGYEIRKIRAFDQFAHTVHVESVVLMSRVGK